MSFRWYLVFMGVGSGLAWAAWTMVLFTVNPYEAGVAGWLIFYSTLLLAAIGTLSLLGVAYRVGWLKREEDLAKQVRTSFRHAIILSLVGVFSLMLVSGHWFRWYWMLAVLVCAAAVEYVFLLVQESKR